jgi:hypothetical protein
MESNGRKGCIQLSQDAADKVTAAGKGHWLVPREDKIFAKGKGELQTYWLNIGKSGGGASNADSDEAKSGEKSLIGLENLYDRDEEDLVVSIEAKKCAEKTQRLVDWTCDVMVRLLKQIIARRIEVGSERKGSFFNIDEQGFDTIGHQVIDEVKEIIELPQYENLGTFVDPDTVPLNPAVQQQLRDYVANIAGMYRDNDFHSFEHAAHVTMSVTKLLSRIVAPSQLDEADEKMLHDHTYGITSDPLTQFACVYSSLIHDCDHRGGKERFLGCVCW